MTNPASSSATRVTLTDSSSVVSGVPTKLFISGTWRDAEGHRTFPVVDPSTGETLALVADATISDATVALDAATAARHDWARTPPRFRSEILRRTFDLLLQHADDVAVLMTRETGKPLAEAKAELQHGAEFLRWFSEEAVRVQSNSFTIPDGTGQALVRKRPVGVIYAITPWNSPLATVTRKIAPALAAGCTVVLKPADLTPLTALYLAQLFSKAGLPAGVLNVVPTSDPSAQSDTLLSDSRIEKLTFTGSAPVGVALLRLAAASVRRTTVELSGNVPLIIFDDADIDAAVAYTVRVKFCNGGQTCTAPNRLYVQEDVADEFVTRLASAVRNLSIGRGSAPGTTMGPLIDYRAVKRVTRLVDDAVARGAHVVAGGHPIDRPGSFFEPTIIDHLQPGSEILTTEIYGPVAAVTRFTSEEDAISLANDTESRIVSYAFTEDLARTQRLFDLLKAGMIGINVSVAEPSAPFGGIRDSGLEWEGGLEGIDGYLETIYSLIPVVNG
jgi:succinate-semialdehyde dehydrogenase/glutarate-semialdehyde dehydrogenase